LLTESDKFLSCGLGSDRILVLHVHCLNILLSIAGRTSAYLEYVPNLGIYRRSFSNQSFSGGGFERS
jgi:hypothetical protein